MHIKPLNVTCYISAMSEGERRALALATVLQVALGCFKLLCGIYIILNIIKCYAGAGASFKGS